MTGVCLVALALELAAPTPAAEVARRAPVRVDADEVQYAFQKHEVTFYGKRPVTLTRDDATLTCRRIVAKTGEKGQVVAATCTGDVRFVRGARVVTCDQANYDDGAERVVCEGNVVLKDAGSEAKGAKLVYDLRSYEAKLEGATITLPSAEIDRRKAMDSRKKEAKP